MSGPKSSEQGGGFYFIIGLKGFYGNVGNPWGTPLQGDISCFRRAHVGCSLRVDVLRRFRTGAVLVQFQDAITLKQTTRCLATLGLGGLRVIFAHFRPSVA